MNAAIRSHRQDLAVVRKRVVAWLFVLCQLADLFSFVHVPQLDAGLVFVRTLDRHKVGTRSHPTCATVR
jgi:hypothetical protein